jgi:hypothetical protein
VAKKNMHANINIQAKQDRDTEVLYDVAKSSKLLESVVIPKEKRMMDRISYPECSVLTPALFPSLLVCQMADLPFAKLRFPYSSYTMVEHYQNAQRTSKQNFGQREW